jgi:ribosomal protein S18 acetylase RimI-like enzyme
LSFEVKIACFFVGSMNLGHDSVAVDRMPVAILCCRRPDSISAGRSPPGILLRPVCADRDGQEIVGLGDSIAGAAGVANGPRPQGRGLVAELTSRPGRKVEAWLATISSPDATGERGAGLVSLVSCRTATGIRHSIGWVLVHPATRRRGVARALVAQACSRAAELAAEAVWVECRSDWAEAMEFWRAVGFEGRDRESTAAARARRPHR